MPDVVDALLAEADAAIAAMQAAALHARALHARAELLRHMRSTATKLASRPLAEAATLVAGEWMAAWYLDESAYADIAGEFCAFTEAFVRNAQTPSPATQHAILATTQALDAALARHGTTLADQMAWRSQCAHGWWDCVVPTPAALPARPGVPRRKPGTAFWETSCAAHCRA